MTDVPEDLLAHLQIPLEDVQMATNNFSPENLIGELGMGHLYKGQLSLSGVAISIAAWRSRKGGYSQVLKSFIQEILILSSTRLKHNNILSFHRFCFEQEDGVIFIYTCEVNGSLDRHISNWNFTWRQRLRMCVGIAHALEYIHSDSLYIYSDLRTSRILLDNNWEPKLYVRPHLERVSSLKNSDIYFLGIVLFDVLCGCTVIPRNLHDKKLSIEEAKSHYEQGNLDDLIHPDWWKQMDPESVSVFSKVAYDCLASGRPNIYEILKRLEKALEVHENLIININTTTKSPQSIPRKIILSATRNFARENLIGRDQLGRLYKGQLIHGELLYILAWRLDDKYGKEVQLSTEISMLCSLDHNNVASIIGYCHENGEKIIIYQHADNGTLNQHLSDPTLTWNRRLQICLGVARALSFIHYDVIHCDISSSKIILDKDWEPKIFGFELSTKYPQSSRHRLLFSGYFDKMSMTPKYDVYLFGLLLFKVLYGKILVNRYGGVREECDEINDFNIKGQMDTQSFTDCKILAQSCLNAQPGLRPTMDHIVQKLELVLELQTKHENLEHSIVAYEGTSSGSLKMELLNIPLKEIRSATNNFDIAYLVGEGGYGTVYKATLEVLDVQGLSSIERKIKDELPKISKTVAIKRINKRSNDQGEQGFLTEIELLSSCKHQNIISLLGYCKEDSEMILVYEYALNGCLSDYLKKPRKINLTWAHRIQICLDVAHGLNYLHSMDGKPMIIHRDIKSENILLDESLKAMVADFGLSKFHLKYQQGSTVETKMIAGTEYYMDPEFLSTGRYKKTTDIYSFGVVMFEVLSRRLAYDSSFEMGNDKGLAQVARRYYNEGSLKELIDPTITEEKKMMITFLL